MAYKITDICVACGTCIDECPVGAISEGDIYRRVNRSQIDKKKSRPQGRLF